MSADGEEIVRIATGTTVQVELYKQRLEDEGVEARVVGEDLTTSFGTALAGSVELWVRKSHADRAVELLKAVERGGERE